MCRVYSCLLVVVIAAVTGCATLPPPADRTPTFALSDTASTRLGRAVNPVVDAHAGKIGVYSLADPRDAFAARVLLAGAAESSLDVQYYIWNGDQVGYLMFEAIWQAAQRGVRVRVLLDDHNTGGLDPTLAALDAHPNIEVRLYNPMVERNVRAFNFITDFRRANRRMHNKSFTADHLVSIVGGRNIGDEYFGAGSGAIFVDMDVLTVGPVVGEVATEFDLYWNSASAYAAAPFVESSGARLDLEAKFASIRADPASRAYIDAVKDRAYVVDLRNIDLEWTTGRAVYDDPAKTLDYSGRTDILLFPSLLRAMGRPDKSFDLISPYLVPGDGGTEALVALAQEGVRIRILTNSLASSDEGVVQAGYAKRRVDLLRAGVVLYELRPDAIQDALKRKHSSWSSASTGLHAKTFAVDRRRVFVGSFNFDQRSAHINTEMGLILDSPTLSTKLSQAFDTVIPKVSYEVRLGPTGQSIEWIERTDQGEVRHLVEPGTTWYQRMAVEILAIMPIEWLL